MLLGTSACADSSSSASKGNDEVKYMGCFNLPGKTSPNGFSDYSAQDPFKYVGYDASPEQCREMMLEGGYRYGGF